MILYAIICQETLETYFGVTNSDVPTRHWGHLYSAYSSGKFCGSHTIIKRNNYIMEKILEHPSRKYILEMEKFMIQNWKCICVNYTHNPNHPKKIWNKVIKQLQNGPTDKRTVLAVG